MLRDAPPVVNVTVWQLNHVDTLQSSECELTDKLGVLTSLAVSQNIHFLNTVDFFQFMLLAALI